MTKIRCKECGAAPVPTFRVAKALVRATMAVFVAALVGCGGDSTPPAPTGIGPAGGTVAGPDGTSVVVPANSLTTNIDIAIAMDTGNAPSLPAGLTALGSTYAFTPHGTGFAVPAMVTVPFDPTKLAAGATPLLYEAEAGGAFTLVATATVAGNTLQAPVSAFSYFVTAARPVSTALAFNALSGSCGRQVLTGQIYCWGDLGYLDPQGLPEATPTLMAGGRAFGQFSASFTAICGISGTDTWCSGDNTYGGLGDGTTVSTTQATQVLAPAGVHFGIVAAGFESACGLVQASGIDVDGTIYCWGSNMRAQLGSGVLGSAASLVPVPIASTFRYVTLSAGSTAMCAIRTTGEVDCWGDDSYGDMGHGYDPAPFEVQPAPGAVPGVQLIASTTGLSASLGATCGLEPGGDTVCWGHNFNGQVGDGTQGTGNTRNPNDYKVPSIVAGGLRFASLTTTDDTTCGLLATGAAYCWGWTGNGEAHTTPLAIDPSYKFSTLSAFAGRSVCGIALADGKTYCWGSNSSGELGLGGESPAWAVTPLVLPGQ